MALETRNYGFSLLELLVVSAVILSITGLAISNYSSFSDTQKIKQAGKTLKNDLRFIQTRAASGVKPTTCVGANVLMSYRVTFTASSYTYQPVCTSGLSGTAQTVTLPNRVSFSPIPSSIDFQVLTGAAASSVAFPMSFRLTGSNQSYSILLSRNGDINDLGFSPTPTP